MIELRNISKTYRIKSVRKRVIDRLSFTFPGDRNVAIAGPNDAGKSTFGNPSRVANFYRWHNA